MPVVLALLPAFAAAIASRHGTTAGICGLTGGLGALALASTAFDQPAAGRETDLVVFTATALATLVVVGLRPPASAARLSATASAPIHGSSAHAADRDGGVRVGGAVGGHSDRFETEQKLRRAKARYAAPGRTIHIAWADDGRDFNRMLMDALGLGAPGADVPPASAPPALLRGAA